MTNKDKINIILVGASISSNTAIASMQKAIEKVTESDKKVFVMSPCHREPGLIEQRFLDKSHKLIIHDEAHIKIEDYPWESVNKALSEFGLKAAEAAENLRSITKFAFKPGIVSRPSLKKWRKMYSSYRLCNVFNHGTPWAPLHMVQAHFFRFDPKKWHTACARIAPMIGHTLTLFHRKCWMHAKTFMNVKCELEVVET